MDVSINLIGEDRNTTVIDGNNAGAVVDLYADGVNISGFTIQNSSSHWWAAGIIIDSSYNTIVDNSISKNLKGIELWSSNNNIIGNIITSNSGPGIIWDGPRNIFISDNIISNNDDEGIYLVWSRRSTITNNNISNNQEGIVLWYSCHNTIMSNNISNNWMGIDIRYHSNNNIIYHNNFIKNWNSDWCNNTWDNGYPSGGNYWSKYNGVDNFSGPNQNIPGSDGIGDTPYEIPGGDNKDRYPLMKPWPLTAEFTWTPIHPDPGETILFNASESYDYEGYITLYEWDWDSDGEFDENHTNYTATHSWSNIGYYQVTLRVTDNASRSDTKTKTVRVGNQPPDAPTITGPTNGKVGTKYKYNVSGEDPDGDGVWVLVEWDDGINTSWLGPYDSSYEIIESHTWEEKGTYTIRAKAKDEHGAESEWGTLDVTMPKNKAISIWKLNRFPLLNRLLSILGRYAG